MDLIMCAFIAWREAIAVEGADVQIVRAAALLHDASGSAGQEDAGENANRFAHQQHSAAFAGQVLRVEGWDGARIAAVQHCILAHRFRDNTQPETVEAQVLFDADKLDAIGAVGVARCGLCCTGGRRLVACIRQFLQTGQTIPGELRSAYHEFYLNCARLTFVHPAGGHWPGASVYDRFLRPVGR
jgi:uncharacterized protein